MYQVKLQQFEGPFDLLLDLIDKKKLSVNEVSLAEVAGQYLERIREKKDFPTEEVASFIVVAATLMLIKSRSLMPSLALSEEEEIEIGSLEKQLNLYKQFRAIAKELEKIFGKKINFAKEPFQQIEPIFIEPKNLSIFEIKAILKEMLANLPSKEILPQAVVEKTITLEQKINEFIKRIENKVALCFSELALQNSSGQEKSVDCKKVDLIVSFLALLELTKRGFIIIKQDKTFGEIEIKKYVE